MGNYPECAPDDSRFTRGMTSAFSSIHTKGGHVFNMCSTKYLHHHISFGSSQGFSNPLFQFQNWNEKSGSSTKMISLVFFGFFFFSYVRMTAIVACLDTYRHFLWTWDLIKIKYMEVLQQFQITENHHAADTILRTAGCMLPWREA